MADAPTTFSVISNDAPNVWIAQRMHQLLERRLQLGQYAQKYQLVQRMGKTLRAVRYKRMNLPTTPLADGVPPDAVALATENVDVTLEQWGIVALITDVAQITTKHPALNIAIDRTGLAMAEVLEREMAVTLLAGTNVFFPGAVTDRTGLAAVNKLDTATILKGTANLRTTGAPDMFGSLYGGCMHPNQEADVLASDTTFKDISGFANVRKFEAGEIGVWMGVRWVRGNFLPVLKGVAAPAGGAPTAEVARVILTGTGGPFANTNVVKVRVVAREISTDYERKISQEGSVTITASDENVQVDLPTSANYVYDVYVSEATGSSVVRKQFSRQANSTSVTLTGFQATGATHPTAPASGVEVFIAWVFGMDAFGRVELDGMSLQSYITGPGAEFSNPLAQGRKVGSKIMWKSFLLDGSFMARIETGSGFPAGLPA